LEAACWLSLSHPVAVVALAVLGLAVRVPVDQAPMDRAEA
jgi:hypothetical protein